MGLTLLFSSLDIFSTIQFNCSDQFALVIIKVKCFIIFFLSLFILFNVSISLYVLSFLYSFRCISLSILSFQSLFKIFSFYFSLYSFLSISLYFVNVSVSLFSFLPWRIAEILTPPLLEKNKIPFLVNLVKIVFFVFVMWELRFTNESWNWQICSNQFEFFSLIQILKPQSWQVCVWNIKPKTLWERFLYF